MNRKGLLPLDEALKQLTVAARLPDRTETVALADALGRVLAQDQLASLDVPPTDNTAMDGYAVRSLNAGSALPVSQRIAAGDFPEVLESGTVARIFTGAPIPEGADAVVMQEDVSVENDLVQLPDKVLQGQHIRRQGQDCAVGQRLLAAGRRLLPQDLGLLASQGLDRLPVFPQLRVALLSTGSELREPGSGELPAGAIYNSNRPMLAGLLQGLGCQVMDLGIVADDLEATRDALARAAAETDAIISCGGVSVGEADFVRDAVAALGAIDLWRIAIKPGKPFAHGRVGSTPFIGLPGNPSSAFVTFVLLARPYLCRLQGRSDIQPRLMPAKADFQISKAGSRREYLRVNLSIQDGVLWARPFDNQSSGVLSSVSNSDALAEIPEGEVLNYGDSILVLPMEGLLA